MWLPTGGHVEKGESLQETVARELKEELGISWSRKLEPFFISQITTVGQTAGHIHNDTWFLIEVDQRVRLNPSKEEFINWAWFKLKVVLSKSSEPNISRAIEKLSHFL